MAKKQDQATKLYHEALENLDGLHASIVELGELCGVDERDPLISDHGKRFPPSQFVAEGEDDPERGGIAFDTRLTLALTEEQAESVMFEIARALREEEKEIAIEMDGRFMIKRTAAADVRRALEDSED